jgi:hypothetical protein
MELQHSPEATFYKGYFLTTPKQYRLGILAIPTDRGRPDVWGVVRDPNGRILWQERVPASISAKEILKRAELLE